MTEPPAAEPTEDATAEPAAEDLAESAEDAATEPAEPAEPTPAEPTEAAATEPTPAEAETEVEPTAEAVTAPLPTEPADFAVQWRESVVQRLTRVRAWLAETRRAALLVGDPINYAWLTGGASNQISADAPPAYLAVLPDRVLVVATSDVLDSALAQVRGSGFSGVRYRWDLGRQADAPVSAVRGFIGRQPLASDTYLPGAEQVAGDLVRLRQTLTGPEQVRLRLLAARLAASVEGHLTALPPTTTTADLATGLANAVREAGLLPVDVRVATLAELPGQGLGHGGTATCAEGVVCHVSACEFGLTASLGRTLLPQASARQVAAYLDARRIYGALVASLSPGRLLREVFAVGSRAAASCGLPELFAVVSPGGLGGYRPAALAFAPDAVEQLASGQVATVTVRLEQAYLADTYLLREAPSPDAPATLELLTQSASWPLQPVEIDDATSVPVPAPGGAADAVLAAEQRRAEALALRRSLGFLDTLLTQAIDRLRQRAAEPLPAAPAEETATPADETTEAPAEATAAPAAEPPEAPATSAATPPEDEQPAATE